MNKISCIVIVAVYLIVYTGFSYSGEKIHADNVPLNINNRSTYSDDQGGENGVLPYMKDFSVQYVNKGDINGDGVIDLTDLCMLSLWLLHDIELTHEQLIAADIVYDDFSQSEPDVADFATMMQIICKDNVALNFNPDKMVYISR